MIYNISKKSLKIESIVLAGGKEIFCKAAILTCGTFLNGLIHIGEKKIKSPLKALIEAKPS